MAERPGYVYRCFDDSGRLIYVGSSVNVEQRMAHHRAMSWWHSQVVRVDCQEFCTIDLARAAETLAIRSESPRWNVRDRELLTDAEMVDFITCLESTREGGRAATRYNVARAAKFRRRLEYADLIADVPAMARAAVADVLRQSAELLEADPGLPVAETLRRLAERVDGTGRRPLTGD